MFYCFIFFLLYVSTSLTEISKHESWKNMIVPAVYINQNNCKELEKDSSQVANSDLVNDSLVSFLIQLRFIQNSDLNLDSVNSLIFTKYQFFENFEEKSAHILVGLSETSAVLNVDYIFYGLKEF